MTPTPIQLNGRQATLTYDRAARFRYGRAGGDLHALLHKPGQDYYQSVLLLWCALDDESRARYPDPSLLVPEMAEDDERFEPVLRAAVSAGWIRRAERADPDAGGSAPESAG